MCVMMSTIPRLISVTHRVSPGGRRITHPIVLILCMHEDTCMCECGGKYGYLGVYVEGAMAGDMGGSTANADVAGGASIQFQHTYCGVIVSSRYIL